MNFRTILCIKTTFLVSYVGERPWWSIQSPKNNERKKKAKGQEDKEITSSLLVLDLKDGQMFHKLHVL